MLFVLDINECSILNGDCHHTCVNTEGSFYCNCRDGYELASNNKTCQGEFWIFEVIALFLAFTFITALAVFSCDNTTNCTQNCIRLFGVEQCSCNIGYELDTDNTTCLGMDMLAAEHT